MSYDTAKPYLASFVLLRKGNKVAFVLRSNTDWMNGFYGLPAGKVEVDERATTGAVRELKEEAGVVVNESDLKVVHISHRKSDDKTLAWIDILFEAKTWKGEPYNAEPHKHGELAWLDINNLPDNIVPAIRFYIESIEKGEFYSEYNWG